VTRCHDQILNHWIQIIHHDLWIYTWQKRHWIWYISLWTKSIISSVNIYFITTNSIHSLLHINNLKLHWPYNQFLLSSGSQLEHNRRADLVRDFKLLSLQLERKKERKRENISWVPSELLHARMERVRIDLKRIDSLKKVIYIYIYIHKNHEIF